MSLPKYEPLRGPTSPGDGNGQGPPSRPPGSQRPRGGGPNGPSGDLQSASLKKSKLSPIWLIPVVAIGLVIYLGIKTMAKHGPTITVTFSTADGLSAQTTQVKHKAVPLGTVENVTLADDLKSVRVEIRMDGTAKPFLTDHARFWVVKPRLTSGNITGLDTLISGSYIEVDPGEPDGKQQREFKGLEEPPGVRSDEPGHVFKLEAERLGSLSVGSPIIYRDVNVGEMLSYDLGTANGPVTVRIFVRAPYDQYVRTGTRFWNTSGISVNMGPQGLHLEIESLQALFAGALAFESPPNSEHLPIPDAESTFLLYNDKAEADLALFRQNVPYVVYFKSSIQGLSRGSAVNLFGVQIGTVKDVRLVFDEPKHIALARCAFEIQPERVMKSEDSRDSNATHTLVSSLADKGMRVVLDSSNFLTGQKVLSFQYVPGVKPTPITQEGDAYVLPSQSGGLENITTGVGEIVSKLNTIPFEEIGGHVNALMASLEHSIGGPEMQQAIGALAKTLQDVRHLVSEADTDLTPALQRLPAIAQQLQEAVSRANDALGDRGYGQNSEIQRGARRMMNEINETARTVRMLVDYLDRHPESLIRGRSDGKGAK